jgi:hypothetical protein
LDERCQKRAFCERRIDQMKLTGCYMCKLGENHEERVYAPDEETAAEEFVRRSEWDAAEFPVASEKHTAIVSVDGTLYEVRGVSEPQYRARKCG